MAKYPINLDLTGRKALVIGAGSVAKRKVSSLVEAGADVTVVAKRVDQAFTDHCKGLDFKLVEGAYSADYLTDVVIAIAATNDSDLNKRIYADCREHKVICNVVDVPELCDFYVPAVVKRGSLQIAIGTDGASPAYSAHVRRKLQEMFTEEHGRFVDELKVARQKVIAACKPTDRKPILDKLAGDESFAYFQQNGCEKFQRYAEETIASYQ
jgi:precorrin-2 dehydrogenase/sirohydrochlorin ferrochelatase